MAASPLSLVLSLALSESAMAAYRWQTGAGVMMAMSDPLEANSGNGSVLLALVTNYFLC